MIADVAHAVAVAVGLVQVGHAGAVVAGVAHAVVVGVDLGGIRDRGAVVAGIASASSPLDGLIR